MSAKTKFDEAVAILTAAPALGVLAGAFLLSAAGQGLAKLIDPKCEGEASTKGKTAIGISKKASAPWNALIAE